MGLEHSPATWIGDDTCEDENWNIWLKHLKDTKYAQTFWMLCVGGHLSVHLCDERKQARAEWSLIQVRTCVFVCVGVWEMPYTGILSVISLFSLGKKLCMGSIWIKDYLFNNSKLFVFCVCLFACFLLFKLLAIQNIPAIM